MGSSFQLHTKAATISAHGGHETPTDGRDLYATLTIGADRHHNNPLIATEKATFFIGYNEDPQEIIDALERISEACEGLISDLRLTMSLR